MGPDLMANLRTQAERLQREANYEGAARLLYGEIPTLEKELAAASEAEAAGRDLRDAGSSAVAARIATSARWLWVAKFVTPLIFTGVFAALIVALFV